MPNPRRVIPVIVGVGLAALAGWYFLIASRPLALTGLAASGTIEATEVTIAAETGGRVAEVLVSEGQAVQAGQKLFRLDDALLLAQRERVATALVSAQDGLTVAQRAVEAAKVNLTAVQASTQATVLPLQQSLDDLQENVAIAQAQAAQKVAAANRAVRESTYLLDNFTVPTAQQKLSALEAIQVAKRALDQARARFEPVKYESSGNSTRESRKDALDQAQADYDAAVRRLEYETTTAQAQASLTRALDDLAALADGPDPDQVAVLEARLAAAQTAPAGAQAALAQAEARLTQAESQVTQAQAELDLLAVQLTKLTVSAPTAGVILTRSIEPGEVVQPGAAAFTLGELAQLTLTVYLPEDRYGAVTLGMPARVRADSFPGQTFAATVAYISDQAEFTPRNVQTQDGRKTTVFAVELQVSDPEGRLKPGMPVDVTFGK